MTHPAQGLLKVWSCHLFLQLSTAIPGYPWPANCLINLALLRLLSLTKRVEKSVSKMRTNFASELFGQVSENTFTTSLGDFVCYGSTPASLFKQN